MIKRTKCEQSVESIKDLFRSTLRYLGRTETNYVVLYEPPLHITNMYKTTHDSISNKRKYY